MHDPGHDRLSRQPFAEHLARSILHVNPQNGFVYAVTGPWGSGKTTVLNFTERVLKQENDNNLVIVHFNPWWISGSDRLLEHFFKQFLSAFQTNKTWEGVQNLPALLELLKSFSTALEAVPEPTTKFFGKGLGILAALLNRKSEKDLHTLRQKINKILGEFSGRIIVFIDDIDRLRPNEIRLVFRLVKAVANFPKTIYVLGYDESYVIRAVGDGDAQSGREYLDKIVQLPLTLPAPDRSSLNKLFFEDLKEILMDAPEHLYKEHEFRILYDEAMTQFLNTPRNVRRFLNLLRATYPLVRGEVNAVDFIGIQVLRLFVPSTYEFVANNKDKFCSVPGTDLKPVLDEKQQNEKRFLESAFESALKNDWKNDIAVARESTRSILIKLFPSLRSLFFDWGRPFFQNNSSEDCRVCHIEVFDRYFFLGTPPGDISEADFSATMSLLPNSEAFGNKLRELASQTRPDGISRLQIFLRRMENSGQKVIPNEHIEPFLQAVYSIGDKLLSELIENEGPGFAGSHNAESIQRLTSKLLKQLPTRQNRFDILNRIFPAAPALFTLVYHVFRFDQEHGRNMERTVEAAHLDILKRRAIERLRNVMQDGSLRSVPNLGFVLCRYADWTSEQEVKTYVAGLVKDDEGLCDYLTGFWLEEYGLKPTDIEHFLEDRTVTLLPRCKQIIADSPKWLTGRYRKALESFINAVESPSNGSGE